MATHEFGIMDRAPRPGERYDEYQPEKYRCIAVDDDWVEPVMPELADVDCFWHTLDTPGKGLDYCGINLIPPDSLDKMLHSIEAIPAFDGLKKLLQTAKKEGKYVIHYGL